MKNTRTTNSIKSTITSMVVYLITIIMGFVTQGIFIRTLGAEYNGIHGLFSNILQNSSFSNNNWHKWQ